MRSRTLLPLLAAACLASPAAAHEVTSEVVRGRAVAVRALTHDGAPLADAMAEVFSPADDSAPFWRGRTDRRGWVAFVPDAPGRWRVRVVDPTGHGIDTTVEVPEPGRTGTPPEGAPPPSAATWVVRTLGGVVLLAGLFGLLFLMGRSKRR